ncbi:hypothetical protein EV421DRAFT_751118 [Armillaria borealis]|uniref:DUF1793-domain-containing protein n=1 Tax=Armillaria borealis TaxID=47425 RepID=A0AA39MNC8_9AGAR|nr:hypothetical protein EV421DRAFT_751118 [Armillaria borealis]
MLLSALFLVVCFTCPTFVRPAFFPAALPLAVRSPYLQCYADTRSGHNVNNQWPQFWTENRILGWSGWIRIDGLTFELWGSASGTKTNLTSFEITPTRTILSIQANTMNVNVTFLSPIEPSNLVLQSLPFSYVYIDVESNDGQEHLVQLYSDISAEWISGDSESLTDWSTDKLEGGSSMIHKASRQLPLASMQEIRSLAEDATVYYASPINNDATYGTANDTFLRDSFKTYGILDDDVNIDYRAISDHFVVLGHAFDLHSITRTTSSVVWAIGLVRDPVVNFYTTSNRSPYFRTEYNTVNDAIDFFLSDFSDAKQRAIDLDNKIISEARQISDNYADLVALATRQALAVDITVSKDSDDQWNTSDVMTFMKDIGDSGRVNPVEILYASFPAYLYINATWAGYLLEPLLRYQQSSQYAKAYAAPDLGSFYPNVSGNSSPTKDRAIEDSGNMLIMGWAHARFSGNGSMISRYYDVYKNWTDYLVSVALDQHGYVDANRLGYANMTNLAIKGIIGIKAMSEISQALGKSEDAEMYSSTAKSLVEQWQTLAGSNGHLLSSYGLIADPSSWSLVYNLYADKLLGTALVNSSIYNNQDSFYSHEVDASGIYGIQYDSRVTDEAKSHWTMFAAGASNDTVRDTLISLIHTQAGSNISAGVFPLTYTSNNGSTISGRASPGQGAMFSLMALRLQPQAVSVRVTGDSPPSNNNQASSSGPSKAGAIAGGVVGGLAALTLLVFGFLMYRRWQHRNQDTYKQRPVWSSTSDSPFFPLQPYDLYGSNGSQHPLQPLRRGQQFASVQSHPQAGQRSGKKTQPIVLSSPTSGPTAVASTTANEPLSGNQSGGSDSDNNTDIDTSVQLRSEMENLRREVDEMRARVYESPPEYDA